MKVALLGYGKMGKTIEKILIDRGHQVVFIIDKDNLGDLQTATLSQADVAIEFTNPESAIGNLTTCFEAGVPVVCGTTGWLQEKAYVEKVCKEFNGGFIYASNFSIGVNIFFEVNKLLAKLIANHPSYDVKITEIHHTAKVDAPSGTAIKLTKKIMAQISKEKTAINS